MRQSFNFRNAFGSSLTLGDSSTTATGACYSRKPKLWVMLAWTAFTLLWILYVGRELTKNIPESAPDQQAHFAQSE